MTGPLTILTITLLATIMFTGALSIAPYAFSTGYYQDDKDDHDDDQARSEEFSIMSDCDEREEEQEINSKNKS